MELGALETICRVGGALEKDTFYYGFAVMLLLVIKKDKVRKTELKKEINRIIDGIYKEFS
ncbi:MAG: hypothetical protein RR651_01125 [Lysinibacillus sp.]